MTKRVVAKRALGDRRPSRRARGRLRFWLRRAKTELEGERAQLRGVLGAATEYSIIGTDPEGVIRVFNEGAERLLGYDAKELIGRATPLAIHDPAQVAARAAELGIQPGFEVFVQAARRGQAEAREWTYVRKDGTRVPVALTVTAMQNSQLTGFIGIARDITEERRAEDARARLLAERAARAAAESALDRLTRLHGVAAALATALTPAQVIQILVEQGMAALGAVSSVVALLREDRVTLEVAASVGRSAEVIEAFRNFPIDSPLPVASAVRTCSPAFLESLDGRQLDRDLLGAWLAGSKSLAAAPLAVDEAEGRAIGGVCFSFAERRTFRDEDRVFLLALGRLCAQAIARARLYEAEGRARAEAERANLAKDEFLAVLSHELRTPLAAVLGWVKMLQKQPLDPARLARGLAVIERSALAQQRLVEDILDTSRIVAGRLELRREPVDVAAAVRGAVEEARPAADARGVTLDANVDPAASAVLGDAERIQQVALNLLSNAVKFTPKGGRVEARLDRSGSWVRLRVTDTGVGISPSFLPHVFERFRQADSSRTRTHAGLGLGLSIAKHVVELQGGTISAESEGIGRGVTFTVLLPASPSCTR